MEEFITCKVCGLKRKQLGTHLKMHNLTSKEYLEIYPGAPLMSEARKNKNRTKCISPTNVEHWIKKGFNEEESLIKIQEVKDKNSESQLNGGSCRNINYWLKRGFTEEEGLEKIKNIQSTNTLEKYISKYGEDDGLKKFKERQIHFGIIQTKEYLMSIGYSEEDVRAFKDQTSLESFSKRYTESEALIKYEEFIKKCIESSKRRKEYWMNIGFTEIEAIKKVSDYQRRDIAFWKRTHGKNWKLKRQNWVNLITKNLPNRWSKESIVFFNLLIKELEFRELAFEYLYAENEKRVNYNGYTYYIDMVIYIDDRKIALEYNGDFWHANPIIYEANDKIFSDVRAKDIWKKDKRKIKVLKKLGYETHVIWSSDDFEDKINYLIREITGNNK